MQTKFSVFLRPFAPDDYILLNKWRHDPEIQEYTGGPVRYVSIEMEKAWVHDKMMNNAKDIYWAICLNDESQRMIGYTSLNDIDHLNKRVIFGGLVIGEKDCRNGISMFEADLLKMDYAFNQLNMHCIVDECLSIHPSTPHTLRALGFKKGGVLRDYVYKNGKYHDIDVYSLLRSEYDEMMNAGNYSIRKLIRNFAKCCKESNQQI
ncbi:MAG: GNAT family N-acetyltransferase [Muribaculaceae bacterium]|nr:GNAT family N-acetyltransferase [Muribaculaceae bacterium]